MNCILHDDKGHIRHFLTDCKASPAQDGGKGQDYHARGLVLMGCKLTPFWTLDAEKPGEPLLAYEPAPTYAGTPVDSPEAITEVVTGQINDTISVNDELAILRRAVKALADGKKEGLAEFKAHNKKIEDIVQAGKLAKEIFKPNGA